MRYIVEFQTNNGLVPDGIIGKKTLGKMKELWGLTNSQLAHYLGQIAEETDNFSVGVENLNYSYAGLCKVFKRYFKPCSIANRYAHNPVKIANLVYDDNNPNRINKLGNNCFGDGWKFRGRGAIQLTGKRIVKIFSDYVGNPYIMENPDLLSTVYFWETALFYFDYREIYRYTDKINIENIRKVTKLVNGGYNGLNHRIALTKHFWFLTKNLK